MGKTGRRDLITNYPEQIDLFLKAVSLGMSTKAACEYANISENVFYDWQKKAEREVAEGKPNAKHAEFLKRFKNAKAKFQMRHIARITQAADDGTWQASAWLLERRCPEEFAQRNNVNLSDQKVVVVSNVSREDGD